MNLADFLRKIANAQANSMGIPGLSRILMNKSNFPLFIGNYPKLGGKKRTPKGAQVYKNG